MMRTLTTSLILLLGALCLVGQAVVGSKSIVDRESLSQSAGNELCHQDEKRISRISSIAQLVSQHEVENFQPSDHICHILWGEPLRDLQGVLDASAQDACSQDTIDKIHEFHWHYVVGTLKRSWAKSARAAIPEPLRLFFLHFAEETARKCQHHLSERLKQAVEGGATSIGQVDDLAKSSFGATLHVISFAAVPKENVKKFDDFFLIFDSIVAAEKKKAHEITTWTDLKTGDKIYMSVKVNNATDSQLIQQICREKLRPVYADTVLPVMRLVDMGFGSRSERIHDELVKEWFGYTQLCELNLPVKYLSDYKIGPVRLEMVTDEQAKHLELEQEIKNLVAEKRVPNVQVSPVRLDDVLLNADDDQVVKQVKSAMKSRGSIYRRAFKNTLNRVKSELKSMIKTIFVSKKSPKHNIELDQSIEQAERNLKEDENIDTEPEGRELVRQKRYIYFEVGRTKWRRLTFEEKVTAVILVIMIIGVCIAFGTILG